ncbi:hypothetical protein K440DRAFT_631108 [Wilcoxina mikolae CBS 423.85]|nr:hypothetical protein K440DRAFT_631108 [Wilcoxina mikolae CBS 423.85]
MVAAFLRQLYPPPPDPSHPEATIKSDIDIVFVHGLNPAGREDHSTHTWTHVNGTFWPEQILPKSIPSARILLFSYNSNVFFGVANATIRHHADSLLDRLHGKRMGDVRVRTIVATATPTKCDSRWRRTGRSCLSVTC